MCCGGFIATISSLMPAGTRAAVYSEYIQREQGAAGIDADWLIKAADVRGAAAAATFVTEKTSWGIFQCMCGLFVRS